MSHSPRNYASLLADLESPEFSISQSLTATRPCALHYCSMSLALADLFLLDTRRVRHTYKHASMHRGLFSSHVHPHRHLHPSLSPSCFHPSVRLSTYSVSIRSLFLSCPFQTALIAALPLAVLLQHLLMKNISIDSIGTPASYLITLDALYLDLALVQVLPDLVRHASVRVCVRSVV